MKFYWNAAVQVSVWFSCVVCGAYTESELNFCLSFLLNVLNFQLSVLRPVPHVSPGMTLALMVPVV